MQSKTCHPTPISTAIKTTGDTSRYTHQLSHIINSVGKTSNNSTISIITRTGITVHKEKDVIIRCKGKPILIGVRNEHGQYHILIIQKRGQWQPRTPSKKAQHALLQANSVYNLPSTEQGIKWMHAVCKYPVKST